MKKFIYTILFALVAFATIPSIGQAEPDVTKVQLLEAPSIHMDVVVSEAPAMEFINQAIAESATRQALSNSFILNDSPATVFSIEEIPMSRSILNPDPDLKVVRIGGTSKYIHSAPKSSSLRQHHSWRNLPC
ncbi:hypothetical protein [Roseivirga seohaensis]|uniref:hypothetical protein n=1 Tax=Roseivirga seohaensis TaxID=1914963 RepID=UPI003BAD63F7